MSEASRPEPAKINPLDHQGVVHLIALKYRNRGMDFDDLLGWGQIGLLKACRSFNPELGFRFTTYAGQAIHSTISLAIYEKVPLVRIPNYLGKPIREGVTDRGSREKTERLRQAVATSRRKRDTEYGLGQSLASLAVAPEDDPIDSISREEAATQAEAILQSLPDREATVLRLRFGIGCDPHTYRQVCSALRVSRVTAHELEDRGIERARKQLGRAS